MTGLSGQEMAALRRGIGRDPGPAEEAIVAAEWSEHCSYKSSRAHLSMLPREGAHAVRDASYDSGVLDVGGGYVVTVHIESHNHPSAVEPYGGAATGVGGVIRDILSAGTRPVAILDGLRFGEIESDAHARWLFRRAVAGIADYGNCIGVPTVGGEVGFERCYAGYAIVDVAAVGFGRRDRLIANRASAGDAVMLVGGATGRDGIGGAQFASDALEGEDRSAVQIPDPFMEKLVIEAILEARDAGMLRALKDLGGGGLSCAASETADSLGVGITIDTGGVHVREGGMRAPEIMTSESQERMMAIVAPGDAGRLEGICSRLGVPCSRIGTVSEGGELRVRHAGSEVARLPASVVANAPRLERDAREPEYLARLAALREPAHGGSAELSSALLSLLSSPNIASREWVYGQYDHEVGIRTVVRPGGDAAMLRLDNGKYLSLTMDGNPAHCYASPREGAAGCFEEACRNTACVGARPIGMVDHLQFGSPEDAGVFWTFLESLRGISWYGREMGIPCVGGKVSFYNETASGPIWPTPVIGVVGLAGAMPPARGAGAGDALIAIGTTRRELGASEYHSRVHSTLAGAVPRVSAAESRAGMEAVLALHGAGLARAAHDCSRGGLAVAVAEVCIAAGAGCDVDLGALPGAGGAGDAAALYSEGHSRYVVAVRDADAPRALEVATAAGAACARVGSLGGDGIVFSRGGGAAASAGLAEATRAWRGSLEAAASG